ncbi:MAG: hypothetical protein WC527_08340 [Candidatus Margulisiibacteriota bacterium]
MIDTLAVIYGLVMIYVSATNRIKTHIKILSMQGILLFFICYFALGTGSFYTFVFLAFETLLVKAIAIPGVLNRVLRGKNIYLSNDLRIPSIYSLIITSGIVFASFIASNIQSVSLDPTSKLILSVSLASIVISLFFITTRKSVVTSVIDYVMMENAIFLLSLTLSKEMPIIVSMGVLLDVFIAVFILGFLINKVSETFGQEHGNALRMLKDSDDD